MKFDTYDVVTIKKKLIHQEKKSGLGNELENTKRKLVGNIIN